MENISFVGILVALCLVAFTLFVIGSLIRAINKKDRKKFWIYLVGSISSCLVTFLVICQLIGKNFESSVIFIATLIITIIFFVLCSLSTLFTVKR